MICESLIIKIYAENTEMTTLWSSKLWSSLPQCKMKYLLLKTYLHITQNSKIMFRIMDDGILPVLFNNFVTTRLH